MATPEKPKVDNIPDMTLPERETKAPSDATPEVTPAPEVEQNSPITKPLAPWERATSVGGWKVGDRVLAPWEPMFCYVGTIQEINKVRAMIQFDDGDAGWVAVDQLREVSAARGQKISSRRKMGALFYPGEIREVRGDEVLVDFEDGSKEWTRIAALRFFREEDDDTQGAEPTKVASHQVFLDGLAKGHRVWAPWQEGVLFVGTVDDLRDDEAHIHFDDGDQGWVQLDHLLPFEPAVGMRVMGNWRMGGQYFPGVVTQIDGDRLHIRYDDGDQEWTTPSALALPGTANASAQPTKTVTHGGGWGGIPQWVIWIGVSVLLIFARIACREMARN